MPFINKYRLDRNSIRRESSCAELTRVTPVITGGIQSRTLIDTHRSLNRQVPIVLRNLSVPISVDTHARGNNYAVSGANWKRRRNSCVYDEGSVRIRCYYTRLGVRSLLNVLIDLPSALDKRRRAKGDLYRCSTNCGSLSLGKLRTALALWRISINCTCLRV